MDAGKHRTSLATEGRSGLTSVVVADDHPIVRKAIVDLLGEEPDLEATAVCVDGREALDAIQQHRPDVALLNLRMPELSGLEVLARLRTNGTATRIILMTSKVDADTLLDAVSMGLCGLFHKQAPPEDLIYGIREVVAGRPYLPDSALRTARKLLNWRTDFAKDVFEGVTEREHQIVACVAEGLSNKQIANKFDISEGTVKIHLHHIYQKLKINNRASLAAVAVTYARGFRVPRDERPKHRLGSFSAS